MNEENSYFITSFYPAGHLYLFFIDYFRLRVVPLLYFSDKFYDKNTKNIFCV